MDTITRTRLVTEGRTRWYCVHLDVGRRFPKTVFTWGRNESDAREIIAASHPGLRIESVTEQHR